MAHVPPTAKAIDDTASARMQATLPNLRVSGSDAKSTSSEAAITERSMTTAVCSKPRAYATASPTIERVSAM